MKEAIRRLVELGLTVKAASRPVSRSGRKLRAPAAGRVALKIYPFRAPLPLSNRITRWTIPGLEPPKSTHTQLHEVDGRWQNKVYYASIGC
jgi:hypothetical protein